MATDITQLLAEINSTRPVLEQVANKWSVLILTVLCSQPSRFNAIKHADISHRWFSTPNLFLFLPVPVLVLLCSWGIIRWMITASTAIA